MEKYILNPTPVRTSVNYGINDVKLDLDIPQHKKFENISIYTDELDRILIDIVESDKYEKTLTTKIGLEFSKYEKIKITIPENEKINNPILLDYLFDDENNYLIDDVEITMEKNSSASFIIHYCEESNPGYVFHNLKQVTLLKENSQANITIANMINNKSDSFISIENNVLNNASLSHTLIELGAKNKISNYYTTLTGDNSENILKSIYLGTNNDLIDINYNIETIGKNTKCNIESQGAIADFAKKNFKGTIDFKKGSAKSSGVENENCMILSETAKSKSMPVLLCHEEDVNGEHGASSGKPDENKLFYIMTKGISYKEARKLIVKANFSDIIKGIPNNDLQNEIIETINQKLDGEEN